MAPRHRLTPAILIFDADNTLWDTNAVFRDAQCALLRPFAARVPGFSTNDGFVTLRRVDRLLFQRLGKFEYDFRLLAKAIAHLYLSGCSVEEATDRAIEDNACPLSPADVATVDQAYCAYTAALRDVPPLLPDTQCVLETLQEARPLRDGLAMTLFSEGDPGRLGRILAAHELAGEKVFQVTHIGPKSPESFERVQEIGLGFLGLTNGDGVKTMVVGDSLKREIKYGNQIGATTVYVPAGFMGTEQPTDEDERPDYSLSRLGELLALMQDLHLL